MRRTLSLLALVAFAASLSTGASAATCRDGKGKFVKCPTVAVATGANRCRDMKTKAFAKCSAPGTEPVPMKPK
jgi:hypothetical protein